MHYRIPTVVFLLIPLFLTAQAQPRFKIAINGHWHFYKGDLENPFSVAPDEPAWERIDLPHTWNTADPFDEAPGYYRGPAWYIKLLDLSHFPDHENAFLYFEGANQVTEVYVNQQLAGTHTGGYTGFCIDISPFLKASSEQQIAIRVDNSHSDFIPPLKGDFNFYGGIYRDLFLVLTGEVHFDLLDHGSPGIYVDSKVDSNKATLLIKGAYVDEGRRTRKPLTLKARLSDPDGQVAGSGQVKTIARPGKNEFGMTLELDAPRLWSPDHPHLYRLELQILETPTGKLLDQVVQPVGLHWFRFDPDEGFFLNGQPLKLIGVNRHQDRPGKGNALSNADHLSDVAMIKAMGANFLRTAHYPQDPAVLQACDRLGLLVSMEIPLDHEITDSLPFYENSRFMMREMIRQYYNHPSIIIWAYMNEMFLGRKLDRDSADIRKIVEFARELEALSRKEDSTRYTMIPNHGDFEVYHRSGLTDIPMIVAWNLYYGWYENDLEGFGRFVDRAHAMVQEKPMIISEYGAGADPRLRSDKPIRFDFSLEWENRFHQAHLRQILERSFIAGSAVWNMFDFGSENRRDAVPHVNNKGLCAFDRLPKDAYFLYLAHLSDKPFLKVAAGFEGLGAGGSSGQESVSNQTVSIFGNVDSALFRHNGKVIELSLENGMATVETPFVAGENKLEAYALKEGLVVEDQQIIDFNLYPGNDPLGKEDLIQINLGTEFQFFDSQARLIWIPEQAQSPGNWGFTGGNPFSPRNRGIGTDRDILGTKNDPLFQTQRIGIEGFGLPLEKGSYRITLLFAELEGKKSGERVFDIAIGETVIVRDFDIAAGFGNFRAVELSFEWLVEGPVLEIQFIPKTGQPVLNGIQVQRMGW